MQYIWEAVLASEKNGIKGKDLQYREAAVRSPYMEVSFCDLNTELVEQNLIEVNPFYRFSVIFERLLDINLSEYKKTREIFTDAVFHYLALTDLRSGMSKKDFQTRFLEEELEQGQFGEKAKTAFALFSAVEKKYTALGLMELAETRSHSEVFRRLFRKIYRNSVIYSSTDCANQLYIYVGSPETDEEKQKVEFLTDTFLPVGTRTEIFYTDHFGILDAEETMVMDGILLI